MSYERQLSKLYLRGSLVNVSMKEIDPQEKQLVELTFSNLINEPELERSKTKFIKRFNRTIRADYKDDVTTSEQDYLVALWRALVDLLVSRKINGFTCQNCKATSYQNKIGLTIQFNQCYHISPCCNRIMVGQEFKNPDECELPIIESSRSPIFANKGERKYSDEILADRQSLIKFVSKHISNYQQQVIKENQQQKYLTEKTVQVPASLSIISAFAAVLMKSGTNFEVKYKAPNGQLISTNLFHDIDNKEDILNRMLRDINSDYNEYHIIFDTFFCGTDDIISIMLILQNHSDCGIIHELHDDKIVITSNKNHSVSMKKTFKEKIKFTTGRTGVNTNGDDSEGLDNLVQGGLAMLGFGDDHETQVEIKEIIHKVADNLNDLSRIVWILQVQSSGFMIDGELDRFHEYATKYPGAKLNNTDLADYLGVSTRIVKRCKEEIETQCFFHGLG